MQRKRPYSNKKKKKQLQEKRERKRAAEQVSGLDDGLYNTDSAAQKAYDDTGNNLQGLQKEILKLHTQPDNICNKDYDANRYRIHFWREKKTTVDERKALSHQPIERLRETDLEVAIEDIYYPGSVLDIPKRPNWSYQMSKNQVERNEEKYFINYLQSIHQNHSEETLSYFEHNLETWRQLWRVLEISNLILVVVDIKNPILHFPPALYDYVVNDMKKSLVLVFNKIDLVPAPVVVAWKQYFMAKFSKLRIVCFTAYSYHNVDGVSATTAENTLTRKRRRTRQILNVMGSRQLIHVCRELFPDTDLSQWEEKIEIIPSTDQDQLSSESDSESESNNTTGHREETNDSDDDIKDEMITIGLIGQPNVGKSSVINGLIGKKIVSTSRSPGHTKHFQTIYLCPTIRLCDSPGIIFPSLIDKQLQILSGLYPISQVKEPYSSIAYIAAGIPLPKLLNIKHPDCNCKNPSVEDGGQPKHLRSFYIACSKCNLTWSAWMICEAWAMKNGFKTAKAARNDVYRAANNLLRLYTDGRLCYYMRPPNFMAKTDWKEEDIQAMKLLQQNHYRSNAAKMEENSQMENDSNTNASSDENFDSNQAYNFNRFALLLENE